MGTTITFTLAQPTAGRGLTLTIGSGYQKSARLFDANASPKLLAVQVLAPDGKNLLEPRTVTVLRVRDPQPFVIAFPRELTVAAVRLEIAAAYPGRRYEDTCISEVTVALDTGEKARRLAEAEAARKLTCKPGER